jgi:hypothetical protein
MVLLLLINSLNPFKIFANIGIMKLRTILSITPEITGLLPKRLIHFLHLKMNSESY